MFKIEGARASTELQIVLRNLQKRMLWIKYSDHRWNSFQRFSGQSLLMLHFHVICTLSSLHRSFIFSQHLKTRTTSYYPVYHSLHDTYHWMKTFIDPKFECHRSVGEFTGRLLLQFADSMVIPFDPRDLTPALELGATNLKAVLPSNVNVTTGKSKL